MIITRRSPLTNSLIALDLPITREAYVAWKGGALLQDVAPRLTADEREFLISGLLPGEFEVVFGPEDL